MRPAGRLPGACSLGAYLKRLVHSPGTRTIVNPFVRKVTRGDTTTSVTRTRRGSASKTMGRRVVTTVVRNVPLHRLLDFIPKVGERVLRRVMSTLGRLWGRVMGD